MKLARALASILVAATLFAPKVAAADDSGPAAPPDDDDIGLIALLTGAVTALVPVAVGATIAAQGKGDSAKDAGLVVAGAGLALAPITAHAVAGEGRRAAAFGAIPVASEIAIAALLGARPDAVYHGTTITRTTFGVLFSVDVFIGALGVVDASLAGDRRRARAAERRAKSAAPTLRFVSPIVAGSGLGVTLGGTL